MTLKSVGGGGACGLGPRAALGNVSVCRNWVGGGDWNLGVKAKGGAKHLLMYRTTPEQRTAPIWVPKMHSVEVEKRSD